MKKRTQAPEALPTLPCWFAEVASVAQILTTSGMLQAIEERVRFARARRLCCKNDEENQMSREALSL